MADMEKSYEAFFHEADADKDGLLTFEELYNMLKVNGYSGGEEAIRRYFKAIDTSGDDRISMEEYMSSMGVIPVENHKEAMCRQLFRSFDLDNDGKIDQSELQKVFAELGRKLSAEEAARMIQLIDKDKSDTIEYEEFIEHFYGKSE